jgi:hypothetical protein
MVIVLLLMLLIFIYCLVVHCSQQQHIPPPPPQSLSSTLLRENSHPGFIQLPAGQGPPVVHVQPVVPNSGLPPPQFGHHPRGVVSGQHQNVLFGAIAPRGMVRLIPRGSVGPGCPGAGLVQVATPRPMITGPQGQIQGTFFQAQGRPRSILVPVHFQTRQKLASSQVLQKFPTTTNQVVPIPQPLQQFQPPPPPPPPPPQKPQPVSQLQQQQKYHRDSMSFPNEDPSLGLKRVRDEPEPGKRSFCV